MQTALRAHLDQLEAGLVAIDGGVERKVEGGFIDILAKDRRGVTTVIELKADVGKPAVIAQTLAYMSCIAEETQQTVRGIIVASDFDARVALAARAVPNLTLRRYKYRFDFE
jgi:RecB family endonuclease NucS